MRAADGGLEFSPVLQPYADFLGAFNHVEIRDDVALRTDDHARALALDWLIVVAIPLAAMRAGREELSEFPKLLLFGGVRLLGDGDHHDGGRNRFRNLDERLIQLARYPECLALRGKGMGRSHRRAQCHRRRGRGGSQATCGLAWLETGGSHARQPSPAALVGN